MLIIVVVGIFPFRMRPERKSDVFDGIDPFDGMGLPS
jgi:hypothetical protein